MERLSQRPASLDAEPGPRRCVRTLRRREVALELRQIVAVEDAVLDEPLQFVLPIVPRKGGERADSIYPVGGVSVDVESRARPCEPLRVGAEVEVRFDVPGIVA